MIVVFLHGPPAAGKHTIGRRLSEATGVPLFHNHLTVDLCRGLFGLFTEPFTRLRERIWRDAFTEAARAQQSFIFTFTPESSVDRALIDDLIHVIQSAGGRVYFVALTCSRSTLLERMPHSDRSNKLNDAGEFERAERSGAFDFPALPAATVEIDTDALTPDEAVERLRAQIPGLA